MPIKMRTATDLDQSELEKLFTAIRGKYDDDIKHIIQGVLKHGICEVAIIDDKIVCAVSAMKLGVLNSLSHSLNDLTLSVHPDYQGKDFCKDLLLHFLDNLEKSKVFARMETFVCESNVHTISFYESVGFKKQGRFEKRIKTKSGYEADIPLVWFNSHYQF